MDSRLLYDDLSVGENGHLRFAGKDVASLAEKYGTPLYLLDEDRIREKCREYRRALYSAFGENAGAFYAGKALCFKGLYRIIEEEGLGIDVVSPGEIYIASEAGFPMEQALFHGNNKTDADISFAMDRGVGYFVCDGEEELDAIDAEAGQRGRVQKILLRVTPGIDPHTHAKITTGSEDSKFGSSIRSGQAFSLVQKALTKKNVYLLGFHCHIGSQIFDSKPFEEAAKIMVGFIAAVSERLGYRTKVLDLGGGIGVRYVKDDPSADVSAVIAAIGQAVKTECEARKVELPFVAVEPGRSIVADAGLTLYTVGSVKEIPGVRSYVSVDGGMTDNPRFALYGARYTVLSAERMNEEDDFVGTVAGRCCESGDVIAENVSLPRPRRGDLLAVLTTGAYNYSMASNYNAIPRPPVVLIRGGEDKLAVRRETFEEMTAGQM